MTDTEITKACGEMCSDNRFQLIEKYKKHLIEHTNIETEKDEVAVLDSLLFRCWQMGWLDKLEDYNRQQAEIERKTKLIADITDEYAKFKEAAKKQEIAKVKHIQQVADEEISRLRVEAEGLKAQSELWYSKYKSLENDRSMLEGHRYSFHDGKLTMIPKTEEKIIKDRAVKEFEKKFEKNIKDVQFTLGQTWEIKHALEQTKKEMVGEDK